MSLPPGVLSKQPASGKEVSEQNISIMQSSIAHDTGVQAKSYDEEYTQPVQWFLTMLLYALPVVNIIYIAYLLVKCDDEDKKNWARGAVVMLAISYVFYIVSFIILKNISLSQLFDLYMQYSASK